MSMWAASWVMLAASIGIPAEQPMPHADGASATVIAAADTSGVGNCVSVSASVPDFWCGQQTSPPSELCKCGDDRATAIKIELKPPEWRSDRNWGHGSSVACTSIDPSVNDFYCTTICASPDNLTAVTSIGAGRCPEKLCRCAEFTAEELVLRDEEEKLVCDFDVTACVGKGKDAKCRTCDRHITICMTKHKANTSRTQVVDDCLDEVAGHAEECGGCSTAESKLGYKVRLGLEAPSQGVDKRVRQRAAKASDGEPLVSGAGVDL